MPLFSNSNSDNILGFVNTSLGMSPLIMFLNPSENEVFITPFGVYINVFPSIKLVFFNYLIPKTLLNLLILIIRPRPF